MCDRPIFVRCVAYELPIPTTVYEIMSNHLGTKKVSTRWVSKLLSPIRHGNLLDCCQALLQEGKVNPDNYFDCIITGDETRVYYYDPLSQQEAKVCKKPGEETPTRLRRTRPTEKIIIVICCDKYGSPPTKYLPHGTTTSGPYYASIIKRFALCHCRETWW